MSRTKKPLLRELIGRTCHLRQEIRLRNGEVFSPSEEFKIISVWRGRFALKSTRRALYIRDLHRHYVDVIDLIPEEK